MCLKGRWIGKENLAITKMNIVIESLVHILSEDAAYRVNKKGGWIKLVAGVIKCDRMALSKLMGYWGGSSQSREGIFLNIFRMCFYNNFNQVFSKVRHQHGEKFKHIC